MNIHHKNMKQISQDMEHSVVSKLSHCGISECNYSYYNIDSNTFMAIPSSYDWHCQYMEQDLDLSVSSRLNTGLHYWNTEETLYQLYKKYKGESDFTKLDFVIKTDFGFEMMSVTSLKGFDMNDLTNIKSYFHHVSYHANKILKEKPNMVLELRDLKNVKDKYNSVTGHNISQYEYIKSKFNDVILTAKEQKYIEYSMHCLTHKEISFKEMCSEAAVRKVITNIKRKLGNESMPASKMLKLLKEKNALSVCSQGYNI